MRLVIGFWNGAGWSFICAKALTSLELVQQGSKCSSQPGGGQVQVFGRRCLKKLCSLAEN